MFQNQVNIMIIVVKSLAFDWHKKLQNIPTAAKPQAACNQVL
jgi:hypothetical protein